MNAIKSQRQLSKRIQHINRFLNFYFKAKTLNNIHSPFLFDLLDKTLDTNKNYYNYRPIESLRERLKTNDNIIDIKDLGAGNLI